MSPRPTRSLGAFTAVLAPTLALVLSCSAGLAASAPFNLEQVAEVRAILPQLDDADFAKREAATKVLQESPTISLDAVGMAFAEPNLSPEQARRLVTAFKARFAVSPRPALGISMDLLPDDRRGIVVSQAIRGLPAVDEKHVRVGDMIVSINGEQPVPNMPEEEIQALPRRANAAVARTIALIQSFSPGDEVTLEILRPVELPKVNAQDPANQAGGVNDQPLRMSQFQNKDTPRERVIVKAKLGELNQLRDQSRANPDTIFTLYGRAAMEFRLRRIGVTWPGTSPVNAAAAINPGSEIPPPAFIAKQALGLAGGGEAPDLQEAPWANNWDAVAQRAVAGGMEFQGIDAQGRIIMRRGNALVQLPAGVQAAVLPQRAGRVNPLVAKQQLSNTRGTSLPAGQSAVGTTGPTETEATAAATGVRRDLLRLADLQSELASAVSRSADPSLDPSAQREAQRRIAELRTAVEDLLRIVQSPNGNAAPTVSAEPADGLDH